MLGYRDSGMSGTPANQHRDAFAQAAPGEAVGRLVRIIRGLRPRVIVTEPPGGSYAHPDHVMCHQVSLAAFHAAGEARAYPEAGPAWPAAKLYAIAPIDDSQWETFQSHCGPRRLRRCGQTPDDTVGPGAQVCLERVSIHVPKEGVERGRTGCGMGEAESLRNRPLGSSLLL